MHLKFICVFILSCSLASGTSSLPMNAHQAGLAGLGTTVKNSFSAFQNPSLSALSEHPSFCLGAENKYFIPELQSYLFQGTVPLKSGSAIGLSGYRTGTKDFFERRLGVHYARKLSGKLYGGIEIFHQLYKVNEVNYSPLGNWSGIIGVYSRPLPFLEVGATLHNPANFHNRKNQTELLSPALNLGLSWMLSTKLFMRIELSQNARNGTILMNALEYKPSDRLIVRAGYKTNPSQPAFGFGLVVNKMKLDAACMYHPVLGFYPSVSISQEL